MTRYTFKECRKRLALLWFTMAGAMFLILVVQSFLGALGARAIEAWGWFLANTIPTISLIATHLSQDADPDSRAASADAEVDPFYYRLSVAVSAFYLMMVLAVMLGWRLTEYDEPADAMAFSSVFIAPLQAVAVSVISIFFRKAVRPKTAWTERPASQGS
jgi:ABC-type glycerol-3-phosphate transport system permease component